MAEPEDKELAPVLLTEAEAPEGNFPINIVDLALLATQNKELELDKAIWDLISGNVKIAVTVFYNVEKLDLLADHFALEDRLMRHFFAINIVDHRAISQSTSWISRSWRPRTKSWSWTRPSGI